MNNKKLLVIVTSIILAGLLAACGGTAAPSGVTPPVRSMNVSGTGEVYITPDIAYIYIGVQTKADTVKDALSKNNDQAKAIAVAMTKLGVDAKDIQTSSFNVYPSQEYGPLGEVTRSLFVVDNVVFVTVRDLGKLGVLLDAVVNSGANTINSISFDVKDKKEAISQARKLAIEEARKQAEEIAAAAGVKLGDIQNLNVYANSGPIAMYEGKGGAMANTSVPIAAGQLMISVTASITYEIK